MLMFQECGSERNGISGHARYQASSLTGTKDGGKRLTAASSLAVARPSPPRWMAFSLSPSIPIVLEEYGGEEVSWVGPMRLVGRKNKQCLLLLTQVRQARLSIFYTTLNINEVGG